MKEMNTFTWRLAVSLGAMSFNGFLRAREFCKEACYCAAFGRGANHGLESHVFEDKVVGKITIRRDLIRYLRLSFR